LRPPDRILCLCARQELLPAHREEVAALARRDSIPWEEVRVTAERHGVAPIIGVNLARCGDGLGIPAETAGRFEMALFENAAFKEGEAERLAAGLVRLAEVGFDALLLKSTALELEVYDGPWVTVSRDIDLVLRLRPGRERGPEEKAVRRKLYRSGIECDLDDHHDVTMNGVLPVSFERIWADARPVRYRGAEAWVMSPEDLLISLCVNAARKRFFRLKGLFDIAETARRLPLDWNRLADRVRGFRCGGIVRTALLATDATLGLPPLAPVSPASNISELDWGLSPGREALLARLVRRFAERLPFAALAGDTGARSGGVSVVLPYVSLGWRLGWKSLLYALTHPPVHRPPSPEGLPAVVAY
jgi:hypothetical protein